MIPYLVVVTSALIFLTVLSLPWSNKLDNSRYQHSEVHIHSDDHIMRTNGLTRISQGNIVLLASLQDEEMAEPIVVRFQGQAQSYNLYRFSITGRVNLLSVQRLEHIMNDKDISPLLLLNDDPVSLDIDILYSSHSFVIIRDQQSGRSQLIAKRSIPQ
ncbi:hypothetical protein ACFFUP_19450 [Vibrio ostreicida]|uniref:Uncharacterized protein n=1 Tax=Vibrio ostreicida TaxID=526588 RepID=A0ABT8BNE7_9VIBR|nr:hypothetical protein [Vibrio ostreicida]MDN3608681.1 hypothetical protein [Vibrio ostreicida]NPD10635.1 hypothetical protein [Vibrio ostreicida]